MGEMHDMLDWKDVQKILARHNLVRKDTAATTPWDGLLLGNADMGAIVFGPAEDPDIYTNPGLREIGVNTLSVHPWDHTRLMIACMRLGMKDKVWEKMLGQKPEKSDDSNCGWPSCGDTFLICEMLLTSWDGALRLFPAWPLEKKARFRDLRAKGAFLVSASCERGQIMGVTVRSEHGNPLTIQ